MAQIIMGLDGLPSSVTVTATQYQPASNKKKHYGRLNLHVANAMGEVGKRVQYTHSSIYELEDMGNAICTFRTQWNTCTGMTVRDTIKALRRPRPSATSRRASARNATARSGTGSPWMQVACASRCSKRSAT